MFAVVEQTLQIGFEGLVGEVHILIGQPVGFEREIVRALRVAVCLIIAGMIIARLVIGERIVLPFRFRRC